MKVAFQVSIGKLPLQDSRGSIAPLGIGLALLSLATVLVFVSANSLFVLQRRLTTLAEATALSVATTSGSASDFLTEAGVSGFHNLKIASESSQDGITAEVKLCSTWQPPFRVLNLIGGQVICGFGAAR